MEKAKKWKLFSILAGVAAAGVGYQIPAERQPVALVFGALLIVFVVCATLAHEEENGPPET